MSQITTQGRLPDALFSSIIEHAPLISMDLVVRDMAGNVLLGKRLNRPAQGYWFVPGGRIRKGEHFDAAFSRQQRSLAAGANATACGTLWNLGNVYKHSVLQSKRQLQNLCYACHLRLLSVSHFSSLAGIESLGFCGSNVLYSFPIKF